MNEMPDAAARIGRGCSLGQNVFVGRNVRIGDGVKVQNNVSIYEGVEVEDDVFLGPSCVFTNVNNPRAFIERKTEFRKTKVGRGASIGANAVIVCGHDIGAHAFVGAGSVVTKAVAAHALVVGNPARRIGWMSRAGQRLPTPGADGIAVCPETAERYRVIDERCEPAGPALSTVASGGAAASATAADTAPIPLLDLAAQNEPLLAEIRVAMDRVIHKGAFILGEEVKEFEREIAEHLGVEHAIGVSSGTDALLVALMALDIGPGDEVITTPFSFFATAGCIARVGAKPVFVDIDPRTYNLDVAGVGAALNPRTKAIMPVHLYGQPADLEALIEVSAALDVPIIEDAAQAIGARAPSGPVGGLGAFGCFSFFPSKNLGAFGDGGLVTTCDALRAEKVRKLRAHGGHPKYFHALIGGNFRLDALQAAVLRAKLPHLASWEAGRRTNAALYDCLFAEAGLPTQVLQTPIRVEPGHVYNQYVIRTPHRDALREHLNGARIGTEIYYPKPLHLQECFAYLGHKEGQMPVAERASREVLALPIFPELGEERVRRVVDAVTGFLRGKA